jgi:neutral ceramidase
MNYSSALFVFLASLVPSFAELRAGAARAVITPPIGMSMAGYYHPRASTGVIDELKAHALVIDDGTQRAALVTLDLIGAPRDLVAAIRGAVGKTGGLLPANVMISATHAHTGPERGDPLRQGTPSSPDQEKYHAALPERIAAVVLEAQSRMAPVQVSAHSAVCAGLTYNRRFYMRDGVVQWNPGKLNPDIMTVAGVTDPQVQTVFFKPPHAPEAHVPAIAAYVNFAMHPDVVSATQFSADYPGALSRRIADYHGADCVTLFGNGACGNLNHFDVAWGRAQRGIAEADRIGTVLAASVFQSEKNAPITVDGPLQAGSQTLAVALPEVTPEEVERAREALRNHSKGDAQSFMTLVEANRCLDIADYAGRPMPVEIQVITLGREVAWVGLPGEFFTELGLALKKDSPFRNTMVVTLANGDENYFPDRRSYAEGAYEARSARVPPGAGEQCVQAALAMLKERHAAVK